MRKDTTLDLTHGSPMRLMIRFATPMLIGNVFQTLYSMVDAAVLGRYVGPEALAAIGSASSTVNLFLMVVNAFTGAVSVVVSQAVGAGEQQGISKSIAASLYICLFGSLLLGTAGLFGAWPLMRLLRTPENVLQGAALYVALLCGGCVTSFAYNLSASILRAMGDSRTPLLFLIVCSLLNIALDLLAVLVFRGGVAGVAIATLASQALSASLCFWTMFRKHAILRLSRSDLRPDGEAIREIAGMGTQMALQSAMLSVGMMVITGVINGFGSDIVAAFTVGSNVQGLVTLALYGFVMSFSIYVGQNYGAALYDHIRLGVRQMAALTAGFCMLATAVSLLFPHFLAKLYVESDAAATIQAAVAFIRIQSYFYIFLGAIELYNATVRGIGKISVCTASAVIELVLKVGCSILFARRFGYLGIWYAAPVGWIVGILPCAVYYHTGRWTRPDKKRSRNTAPVQSGAPE